MFISVASIKNFSELEVLLCLTSVLEKNDHHFNIVFAYLFGIRCDRAFEAGMPNYFTQVIQPIISNTRSCENRILWPFAPLAIHKGIRLFKYSVGDYIPWLHDPVQIQSFVNDAINKYTIISGDKTAIDFFHPGYVDIYFDKKRCNNGEISIELNEGFIKKIKESASNMLKLKILIVDDLCDGGATFIAEAKYLKKLFPDISLSLFVYHGIFSKGITILLEHFDHIYCTNSYQTINHSSVTQLEVI